MSTENVLTQAEIDGLLGGDLARRLTDLVVVDLTAHDNLQDFARTQTFTFVQRLHAAKPVPFVIVVLPNQRDAAAGLALHEGLFGVIASSWDSDEAALTLRAALQLGVQLRNLDT
jgi:DNA-binding NarL/FixJ family response regulator